VESGMPVVTYNRVMKGPGKKGLVRLLIYQCRLLIGNGDKNCRLQGGRLQGIE